MNTNMVLQVTLIKRKNPEDTMKREKKKKARTVKYLCWGLVEI